MSATALRAGIMSSPMASKGPTRPGSTKGAAPPFPVQSKKPKGKKRPKVKQNKKQTKGGK